MSVKLALDLIQEYHGVVVAAVANALFSHGPQTLGELLKQNIQVPLENITGKLNSNVVNTRKDSNTQISVDVLRSALVILIRYQIVQIHVKKGPKTLEKEALGRCIYSASSRHALMLLRSSRIIEYTRKNIGKKEAYIVEELLIHGGASKEDILKQISIRVALKTDEELYKTIEDDLKLNAHTIRLSYDLAEEISEENETEESLLKTPWAIATSEIFDPVYDSLVKDKVIINFKLFGAKTESTGTGEVPDKKSGNSNHTKTSKVSKAIKKEGGNSKGKNDNPDSNKVPIKKEPVEEVLTHSLELKVMLERASVVSQKSKARVSNGDVKKSVVTKSKKRRRTGESVKEIERSTFEWMRVNFNYFLQAFRLTSVQQYLVEKLGTEDIRKIPEIAFNFSKRLFDDDKLPGDFEMPRCSKTITTSTLLRLHFSNLEKKYAGQEAKILNIFLQLLAIDPKEPLQVERDSGNHVSEFRFDWYKISEDMKARCVLNMVTKQYGRRGARITRLLLEKGALEEKQVADLSMMPRKEARNKLFAMLRRGLVEWEEAPRKADFDPSYTYHLWSVKLDKIVEIYKEECYKSILNMRIRYRAFSQHNKELDRFTAYEDEVASGTMTQDDMMQIPGVEKYHAYRLAFDKLDSAVLNLDKSCLLLAHF